MRILHLDPDDIDNPLSGGGPVRTLEIYRRIARRHEVTILTPTFEGSTPELERDGIRYVRLGKKLGEHGSSHHITFLMALPKAVRTLPHDLLVEDFMPPFGCTHVPLLRRRSTPHIASIQWFSARDYTKRLKLPFHWGQQWGLKLYDHFVVLTPSMENTVKRWNPSAQVKVIPNGVDDALFDLPIRAGQGILFLGRVEIETKGIDLLLQAYARIPEALRPGLTIAGKVQEPDGLQRCLVQCGLQGQVKVHGAFDAKQRQDLLQSHRVLAMPSRTETFGMTVAEANAAGRISVVWDIAPMNEVASSACSRVKALDVDAYAASLMSICSLDDETICRRGEVARAEARRFNWDALASQQMAFYESRCQAA